MMRKWLVSIVAVLAAAAVAEGVVRLAMHSSLDYLSDFSPGPYCVRPGLGISFNCPGRSGVMHPEKSKVYAPYHLNADGFRGPFRNTLAGESNARRVLLLGGQSQGFGFGLSDQQTMAAWAARSACGPVDVQLIALPGTSAATAWSLYTRNPTATLKYDHIIFQIYIPESAQWPEQIDAQSKILTGNYAVLDGWVFAVPAWLMSMSDSYVAVRSAIRAEEVWEYIRNKLLQPIGAFFDAQAAIDSAPETGQSDDPTREFARIMAKEAARLGAKFSVVLLPGTRSSAWPWDIERLENGLDGVSVIDLDAKATSLGLFPSQLLSDGHYNPQLAAFLGSEIGQEICRTDFASGRSDVTQ